MKSESKVQEQSKPPMKIWQLVKSTSQITALQEESFIDDTGFIIWVKIKFDPYLTPDTRKNSGISKILIEKIKPEVSDSNVKSWVGLIRKRERRSL